LWDGKHGSESGGPRETMPLCNQWLLRVSPRVRPVSVDDAGSFDNPCEYSPAVQQKIQGMLAEPYSRAHRALKRHACARDCVMSAESNLSYGMIPFTILDRQVQPSRPNRSAPIPLRDTTAPAPPVPHMST